MADMASDPLPVPAAPAGVSSLPPEASRWGGFLRIFAWAGRRPLLLAPALGMLAACGFQPLALWPLTLLGVAGLIALVARAETGRRALLTGWLWGIGHFTLGNNWIATAFTYQAKMPAWLGWLAVFLLSLYLAVWPALAALGGWLARRDRSALVLAFAGCWIVTEWLRGWVCTGFPWNPLATTLLGDFGHPGLALVLPWLGTYAGSGLVALLAGILCWPFLRMPLGKYPFPVWAFILVCVLIAPSGLRLATLGSGEQGRIPFTLIQPNIAQAVLDDPANYEAQFATSAMLSRPVPGQPPRLVLWPESGVPDYLRDGYPAWYYQTTFANDPKLARWRIGQAIGPTSALLTGSTDLVFSGEKLRGGHNIVIALDGQGRELGVYAKAHLVPYGEYLPMRDWLQPLGLARLVPGDIDFWPGPGPRTLDLGRLGKAGVQICYEIVFSGEVVDRDNRPDYVFNPSNDGWFGAWGPPQHLAQARLRAIEEGLPVLRATTNGISAVVDADGVVRAFAPRGQARRIDSRVPPAHAPTLFARFGNMVPLGWALLLLCVSLLVLRRRRG